MKKTKINFPVYNIVEDGGMSTGAIGEGRFLPILVIDTKDNFAINELLKLHQNNKSGDAEMLWASPKKLHKTEELILKLKFLKPMDISFGVRFTLENQSTLIDGIIQSRGFHLYTGKKGEKVSQKIDSHSDSILIEVPDMGFDEYWNKLFLTLIQTKFKIKGYSLAESKLLAEQSIKSMREVWNVRR